MVKSKNVTLFKISFSHSVGAVDITDVETGIVKSFNSNCQAAKYLNINEWTIRSYKKSKKLYKGKYQILSPTSQEGSESVTK